MPHLGKPCSVGDMCPLGQHRCFKSADLVKGHTGGSGDLLGTLSRSDARLDVSRSETLVHQCLQRRAVGRLSGLPSHIGVRSGGIYPASVSVPCPLENGKSYRRGHRGEGNAR